MNRPASTHGLSISERERALKSYFSRKCSCRSSVYETNRMRAAKPAEPIA